MSQAPDAFTPDFVYPALNGVRPLGPPHQRFPHMHPEKGGLEQDANPVYMEIPTGRGGVVLTFLGATFLWCMLLGIGINVDVYLESGKWGPSDFWIPFLMGGVPAIIFFALATRSRPPLPIRLNRITQELIYSNGIAVGRIPWATLPVRICKTFDGRGASSSYALQFDFGKTPKQKLWSDVGGGARYEEAALRDWEFFCRYMESTDGYVETRELSKEEKSAARKGWEWTGFEKIQLIIAIPVWPIVGFVYVFSRLLKYRSPPPWPQEVQDICENHPLYQEWLRYKKGKGRWAKA